MGTSLLIRRDLLIQSINPNPPILFNAGVEQIQFKIDTPIRFYQTHKSKTNNYCAGDMGTIININEEKKKLPSSITDELKQFDKGRLVKVDSIKPYRTHFVVEDIREQIASRRLSISSKKKSDQ